MGRLSMRARGQDCSDEGAGSVEYIALLLVVLALLSSIAAAFTSIGDVFYVKVCEVFGGDCPSAEEIASDADQKPDVPCSTSTQQKNVQGKVSVAVLDAGAGGRIVIEEMSDGEYRVTLFDTSMAGFSVGAASGGELRVGETGGGGLMYAAEASGALNVGSGREYRLGSQGEVDDFVAWAYEDIAARTVKKATSKNLVTTPLGLVVDIGRAVAGSDYDPPSPVATYAEGSVTLDIGGKVQALTGGASAGVLAAQTVGYRQDAITGEKTIYSQVDVGAAFGCSDGSVNGSHGTNRSMLVEMTMDRDNTLVRVGIAGTLNADGLVDLTGAPWEGSGEGDVSISASFDVTDENRLDTYAALHSMEVVKVDLATVAPSGANPSWVVNHGAAAPWIVTQALNGGSVTAQEVSRTSENIVSGRIAAEVQKVGVGADLNVTASEVTSRNAWYLGDHGWHEWMECG